MDNNILNLFNELKKLDANLYLDNGILKLNIKEGLITKELADAIKQNKDQIIALLSSKKNADYIEIEKSEIKSSYPLSPSQSRLWVLSQIEAASVTYNLSNFFKLENDYDVEAFKQAIWSVLERHEILRTVFREDSKGGVTQYILELADLNFEIGFEDYSEYEKPEYSATAYINQDIYLPFDLEKGPLIRVCLLKLADSEYMLYYNMHHIICDGWSMNILARDIMAYYKHHTEAAVVGLPELQIQYKDYASWQLKELETKAYQAHKKYWLDKISGDILTLNLPSSKQRPLEKTFNGRQLNVVLAKEVATDIKNYVAEKEGTLFMFLLSSLKVLFYRYTSQEDIVVTSPVAGRGHLSLEDQIGFYVNTIAVKSKIKNTLSFDEFYGQVKQDLLGAYANQMYPFDLLVDELNLDNDKGRSGLFDVRVVLQNTVDNTTSSEIIFDNIGTVKDIGQARAKFDMLFTFIEIGDHIEVDLVYNTDVYEKEMLVGFLTHYQQVIKKVVEESNTSIGEIDYLSEEDRSELLNDWSSSLKDKTIVDLFEEQVLKSPQKTAVVFGDVELSYEELDERSNLLAQELQQAYKISSDDLIGIVMPVSEWSIVAILAILKAGAGYVPIDESMPVQRAQYIIDSTKIKALLIVSDYKEKAKEFKIDQFIVDEKWESLKDSAEQSALKKPVPNDLAYVIHTSGSTGNPKGVMITHANLIDYTTGLFEQTEIAASDSFALMSNIATDLGNTVIYSALLTGGALHLLSKEKLRNSDDIHDYFHSRSIDCIKIVPSHWQALSKEKVLLLPKRLIVFGGDSLPVTHVKAIHNQSPTLKIINHYGPTETTIGKLLHQVDHNKDYPIIPIGKPFSETCVYVVDKQLKICPKGVAGELLIGGQGVARGYLNKPELTEKQFIQNPFTTEKETLYRTGDLVRMLADGNIEFLGRIDNQVKIRGNRVELGAIESVLSKKEEIDTVLVLAKEIEEGEKVLIAYYSSSKELTAAEMRFFLEEHLPNYMVPGYFAFVEKFPLTANGKINRKALPDPTVEQNKKVEIQAPTNKKEQALVDVWSSVLKRENISINDDFIELGGDSIKSILVVSRLKKQGFRLKVSDILKMPVLSKLATVLTELSPKKNQPKTISQLSEDKPKDLVPGDLSYKDLSASALAELNQDNRIENVYQLSPLQQGLYYHWISDTENSTYAGQRSLRVKTSQITLSNIQKAYELLIERHPILRTEFTTSNGELLQVVRKKVSSTFVYEDFSKLDSSKKESAVSEYKLKDHERGFAINEECLMRLTVLDLGEELYEFIWSSHHIIMDGWCTSILINEFYQMLLSLEEGQKIDLPPVVPYSLYIEWLNKLDKTTSIDYWQKYLSDYNEKAQLPFKGPVIANQEYLPQEEKIVIKSTQLEQLKELCKESRITESTFMQVVWGYLLSKYNNTNDVVFGSIVSGRPGEIDGIEDMIGLFINTIPVRIQYSGEMTVIDLLKAQQKTFIESLDHHYLSLAEVQRQSSLGNGLIDHVFLFQNYSVNELESNLINGEATEKKLSVVAWEAAGQTHYDFDITVVPGNEELEVCFNYDGNVYDQKSIAQIKDHLSNTLSSFLDNPQQCLKDVSCLSEAERSELLHDFNDTARPYPKDKTSLDLFEDQVLKTPDSIAVVFEGNELTYQQLNEKSNQLAHYLMDNYEIKADDFVGIMLDRSDWVFVSLLAIWKTGGAYVPIDVDYPEERISYIISDSGCKALIDEKELKEFEKNKSQYGFKNPGITISPNDLSYLIYTSGSTGNPKGVMVSHTNLVARICYMIETYDFDGEDSAFFYRSFSFDGSVEESLLPVLSGAKCFIAPRDFKERMIEEIIYQIEENKLTIFSSLPALLYELVIYCKENKLSINTSSIKYVVSGGDKLSESLAEQCLQLFPGTKLFNTYGPTECTVDSTHLIIEDEKEIGVMTIGYPILNTQVYILDKNEKLLAKGVVGEICIGGVGVARGYLNRPELTAEKFVASPFKNGEKIYKTGDLGRWLPNGTIEFLGRMDDQVKIRGHRIELGEIERTLYLKEEIDTNLVLAKETDSGDKYIAAYYSSTSPLAAKELRSFLMERLPIYMIPSHFVFIEIFPLTSNGKIDKKALPDPGSLDILSEVVYEEPRNVEEKALVEVWESVLKRNRISIHDSFYDLGGDSIKSIQVSSRLKQLGYELKVTDLLRTPVLSSLSRKLNRVTRKIDQSAVDGEVLLNPIQHSFLFSENYAKKSHYNQSIMLDSAKAVDIDLLEKSLEHLVKHHDALRMVYKETGGNWYQENKGLNHKGYSIDYKDFRGDKDYKTSLEVACNKLQSSINMEEGPLLKVGLFRLEEKDCILLVIHHLVVDGVSWRIFLEDLGTVYGNLKKGESFVLPQKTDSFQRWTLLLDEYAKSEKLEKERSYWEGLLTTEVPPLNKIKASSNTKKGSLKHVNFSISKEIVELLQTKTHRVYNTEINDVLLTGLGLSIQKVFGNDRVVIEMEGHGREGIIEEVDITRTIGWFTSVYPFVLSVGEDISDFRSSLIEVKESLRKIPNKGIGYGILNYMGSGFEKEIKPALSFNYLGDFGKEGEGDEKELFVFSGEPKGLESSELNDNLRTQLSVSGMLVNGQLGMNVSYNDSYYSDDDISELMVSYKNVLELIIQELSKDTERYLTPNDLSYKYLSVPALSILNENNNIEDVYRLSPLQEGMYYHWVSSAEKAVYFCQNNFRLKMSEVSINNIEESYRLLIARHPILRTAFNSDQEEILQVVRKEVENTYSYEDISKMSKSNQELYIADYKKKDQDRGFTLNQESLMRLTVIHLGEGIYEFTWSNHHILMDGWCASILVNEFYQMLMSLEEGIEIALPPVKPYSSYINWLDEIDKKSSKLYWQNYLKEYSEKADLPFKTSLVSAQEYLPKENKISVASSELEKLKQICSKFNLTESTFMQTVWGYLLSKYNNTNDVVYGSVVSGRPGEIAGVEDMIGLFINTTPVRIQYTNDMTVLDLLKAHQETSIASLNHHYLSLAEVHSVTDLGNELFDHIYLFQNYAVNELDTEMLEGQGAEEKISFLSGQSIEQTNYDFEILVVPSSGSLDIHFKYNGHVYDEQSIKQIESHLVNVLSNFLDNPQMLLKDVSYLSDSEQSKLLDGFNDTLRPYAKDKTIIDSFEEQVANTPDNIAVVFGDKKLTYQDLNEHANQLANYLKKQYGINSDELVGIKLEPGEWIPIAILGVLKAGGAYLFIDPNYPEERIDYMVSDSKCKVIIDGKELSDFLKDTTAYERSNPKKLTKQNHLAYALYTSGSTGLPKGVQITHGALNNYINWAKEFYWSEELTNFNFGLYTSLTFDLTLTSLFVPITSGSELRIFKNSTSVDLVLEDYLTSGISCIKLTPAHINVLSALDFDLAKIGIEMAIVGGEALQANHVEILQSINPKIKIYNEYGPTEATVGCITKEISQASQINIGKPISNTQIYILSKELKLCPIGITGELFIGGDSLSKGYLNREELTKEMFIENPFEAGKTLYRTGDLGRWTTQGEIEYVGRIDNQVKIRGHRIELGEIESRILISAMVENAAVLVSGEEHKYLVAYIVPKDHYSEDELYTYLDSYLPDYMLPGRIIILEEFPLTSNGKINRKALAELEGGEFVSNQYVAPGTELEKGLVEIWEDVLEFQGFGIRDNFFRIGGDSILTLRLISKIKKKYQSNITIAQVYEFNTIESLAAIIEERIASFDEERRIKDRIVQEINELKEKVLSTIDNPQDIEDIYPMSDIQKGMIALSSFNPESRIYNNQAVYQIPKVDSKLFEKAFSILAAKHATLRTQFDLTTYDKPIQIIKKEAIFTVDYKDLSSLDKKGKDEFLQNYMAEQGSRPFKPASELLWRTGIFDINKETSIFFIQEHHALLDGWSVASLHTELFHIYKLLESNTPVKISTLQATTRDAVIGELYDKKDEQVVDFWKTELADYKKLDIFGNENIDKSLKDTYSFDFKYKLESRCKEDGISVKGAFYAAFIYALKMVNYENDFIIGLVSNNRPAIEDGDRVLGCFLNTIPLRNRLAETSALSWLDYFRKAENNFARIKPQERLTLYEITKVTGEDATGSSPFFDVIYNYTNFHIYKSLNEAVDENEEYEQEDIDIQPFAVTNTALDLDVSIYDKSLILEYSLKRNLKNNVTLEKIHQYVEKIISYYLETPQVKIKDSLLLSEENMKELSSFNKTTISYPADKTILDLLSSQVKDKPANIAVSYRGNDINYEELDKQSNQLAHYLKTNYGVEKNDLVAMQLERSEWMLISILGILKAGGGYIPMDMDYPAERVAHIKTDSEFKVCIDASFISAFQEKMATCSKAATGVQVKGTDLAYGIFTSGSTGRPKGVLNAHEGLYNRLLWMRDDLKINQEDIILQKTPYTFDVSVWELLMPGIIGAQLVFAEPQGHKDPAYLQQLIKEKQVSILHFVPSMLGIFLEHLDPVTCKSLRHIVCSGEALPASMVEEVKEQLPWVRIHNLYGPTEAAIDVTSIDLTEIDTAKLGVSIGMPVANTKIYIVDKELNLQPVGVPGELLIEGIQVAQGYLNRPELNAEKFLSSPFTKGERLYRTGDLTKWLPNGEIAYLGRIDNQIKIRGNRVELGEIENVLLDYSDDIKQTILKLNEEKGAKFLVAYYTTNNTVDKAKLKTYLTSKLPDYMIPSFFKELENFPLLPNGKINRKLLPDISDGDVIRGNYIEPENEMQKAMIEIIQKELGDRISKVGITDNFFDLGLDSLSVLRVQKQLNATLNLELKPLDFFQYPNVQSLINNVMKIDEEEHQLSEEISEEMDDVLDFF